MNSMYFDPLILYRSIDTKSNVLILISYYYKSYYAYSTEIAVFNYSSAVPLL